MWTLHSDFNNFLQDKWSQGCNLNNTLNNVREELKIWNKEVFDIIFRIKRRILNRLAGVQTYDSYGRNHFLDQLEASLNKEVNEILDKEEVLWLQKSREQWIIDSDRNPKFYHIKIMICRRKNRIFKLRNQEGSWIEDVKQLKDLITSYLQNLYNEEVIITTLNIQPCSLPNLEANVCRYMEATPTEPEIKKLCSAEDHSKPHVKRGFQRLFSRTTGCL
ncbi:Retrovirus-related Pol polyprotein [Arachis hypogaea]|nr:Retrovirus-related Pol polyprotein [Arachis hypogaea]